MVGFAVQLLIPLISQTIYTTYSGNTVTWKWDAPPETEITVELEGSNVALGNVSSWSDQDTNLAVNASDGDLVTRWSASPWPQWIEYDLGSVISIERTELVAYQDRAYRFIVEASTNGVDYTQIVDRSNSTQGGSEASPIEDTFPTIEAQFVRLTVTGAAVYQGPWASIEEFRIFGQGEGTIDPDIVYDLEVYKYSLSGNHTRLVIVEDLPSTSWQWSPPITGIFYLKIRSQNEAGVSDWVVSYDQPEFTNCILYADIAPPTGGGVE